LPGTGTRNSYMMHTLKYGDHEIDYRLVQEDRLSIQVAVYPDSTVVVKVPSHATLESIESKLKRKARWILKQRSFFLQFSPKTPPKHFVIGETHLYLGKQYRLAISKGENKSVKLIGGKFLVSCNEESDSQCVKNALDDWYRTRAENVYATRLQDCWVRFEYSDSQYPKLSLRRMKTRWGSLSERGVLTLNTSLIKAPVACLDYVVTHELCHLEYPNHDAKFFRLLESKMPNWSKLKNELEQLLS